MIDAPRFHMAMAVAKAQRFYDLLYAEAATAGMDVPDCGVRFAGPRA